MDFLLLCSETNSTDDSKCAAWQKVAFQDDTLTLARLLLSERNNSKNTNKQRGSSWCQLFSSLLGSCISFPVNISTSKHLTKITADLKSSQSQHSRAGRSKNIKTCQGLPTSEQANKHNHWLHSLFMGFVPSTHHAPSSLRSSVYSIRAMLKKTVWSNSVLLKDCKWQPDETSLFWS